MLSDREKKEMLSDGLDRRRGREFSLAEKRKPKSSRALNDYLAFLMNVQKIKPFEHKPVKTVAEKNIL